MARTISPERRANIIEARRMWQSVLDGDLRARAEVMETLTTSDFPILLGAAYGRELVQEYQARPAVWQQYASRRTVPDFKNHRLVEILGGRGVLDKVKEASEYKARSVTEGERSFSVEKYGNRIPLTWEMLKNDELDAFRNLPERLSIAARETEDVAVAKSLFNTAGNGLNTQFFRTQNGNAPANVPLTSENLEAALSSIRQRVDSDNRPVVVTSAILMVSPALEMTARRILEASEIRIVDGNTTSIQTNYLRGIVNLVVNPWLSLAAPGFAKRDSTWFLLPATADPRPAVVAGFLRGEEQPDLRVRNDQGTSVGGGALSPEDGSFDDDTVQYRVRHVIGGAPLFPAATYVSTGS